ncbi:MAG: hypothetical protein IJ588_00690, partial [Prevotella sp.]|nr:hypothetical protein [Prevotella sp.]
KFFGDSEIMFIFAPEMPAHERVGTLKQHRWNETRGQLYAQSRKDVFLTLLSVMTNLANLNLNAAVMQQKRPRGLILYPPATKFPFIYNKVYATRWAYYLCVCMGQWDKS